LSGNSFAAKLKLQQVDILASFLKAQLSRKSLVAREDKLAVKFTIILHFVRSRHIDSYNTRKTCRVLFIKSLSISEILTSSNVNSCFSKKKAMFSLLNLIQILSKKDGKNV